MARTVFVRRPSLLGVTALFICLWRALKNQKIKRWKAGKALEGGKKYFGVACLRVACVVEVVGKLLASQDTGAHTNSCLEQKELILTTKARDWRALAKRFLYKDPSWIPLTTPLGTGLARTLAKRIYETPLSQH